MRRRKYKDGSLGPKPPLERHSLSTSYTKKGPGRVHDPVPKGKKK